MANGANWLALFCDDSRFKIDGDKELEKTVFNFKIHLHNRQIYLYLHPKKRPRGATE